MVHFVTAVYKPALKAMPAAINAIGLPTAVKATPIKALAIHSEAAMVKKRLRSNWTEKAVNPRVKTAAPV
jgi:hypothetical protein